VSPESAAARPRKLSESVDQDLARNQLRYREGRFDLSVYQPDGVVKLTLTGA
jgi:hypothetical protein